jgi:hypothetical protein
VEGRGEFDSTVVALSRFDFIEPPDIDETFDCGLHVGRRVDMEAARTEELASEISLFCRVLARWLFLFEPSDEISASS